MPQKQIEMLSVDGWILINFFMSAISNHELQISLKYLEKWLQIWQGIKKIPIYLSKTIPLMYRKSQIS